MRGSRRCCDWAAGEVASGSCRTPGWKSRSPIRSGRPPGWFYQGHLDLRAEHEPRLGEVVDVLAASPVTGPSTAGAGS